MHEQHKDWEAHWNLIYASKPSEAFSWYEPELTVSVSLFQQLHIPHTAKILDVGGGDSTLVDSLLRAGYRDITVLDISALAIQRAQLRLGEQAGRVKWIVADVRNFEPDTSYDVWHDRATFHFLIAAQDIQRYVHIACKAVKPDGRLILGCFADNGPQQCSGLPVHRYAEHSLASTFASCFTTPDCFRTDHITPTGQVQHFLFCHFRRSMQG
ncbi:MAG: class I SAM-dependent methyltransferase [Thermoflavifilum sp.]|nr:class I SAM-dependent methyltransferase [Thermoflavifilum sp.]